jgi:hypothetical protein
VPPNRSGIVDRWLSFGLLMVLAAMIRVIVVLQLADSPCLQMHRWAESDMAFFDYWAQQIVAGDWLSAHVGHPFHGWHDRVARTALMRYPARSTALIEGRAIHQGDRPESLMRAQSIALWAHWYGGPRFHQAPLYPYSLALLCALTRRGPQAMLVVQLVLGWASLLLLARIAARHFSPTVARVAVLLAIGYAPLLAYDLVLLRCSWIVFWSLLLVELADQARDSGQPLALVVFGLFTGLGMLLKPTFVLYLAVVPWVLPRARLAVRLRALLLIALATALPWIPLVARNLCVGAPPLALSSVGPVTFAVSWAPTAVANYGFVVDDDHLARVLLASDGASWPTIQATLAEHRSWMNLLHLGADKFMASCGVFEIPNNANVELFRQYASLLWGLPIRFSWLLALAVLGLIASATQRLHHRRVDEGAESLLPHSQSCRHQRLTSPCLTGCSSSATLHVALLVALLPLMLFYMLCRFRLPVVVLGLPLAAHGLCWLGMLVRSGSWRTLAVALAIGLAITVLSERMASPLVTQLRPEDVTAADLVYYSPRINESIAAGDIAAAIELAERQLRDEPLELRRIVVADRAIAIELILHAKFFAALRWRLAALHERCGATRRAMQLRSRAWELAAIARARWR